MPPEPPTVDDPYLEPTPPKFCICPSRPLMYKTLVKRLKNAIKVINAKMAVKEKRTESINTINY